MDVSFRIIYIISLIIMVSCRRDLEPFEVKCPLRIIENDESDCSITRSFVIGSEYESPVFNPNDNNEFLCVADNKLVKFNIESNQTETLVDSLQSILTPDWGRTGWIVFSAEWNIWKIRDDGTQLTKITHGPREIWPKFNRSGEQFVYTRNMEYGSNEIRTNPELRRDYKLMVSNIEGQMIDSFCRVVGSDPCYPWTFCSWSPNSEQFVARNNGLAVYDLAGNKVEQLYNESEASRSVDSEIQDIEWHPVKENIYFQDGSGIRFYDFKKQKVKKLRISCPDEQYGSFSISGDGKFLIVLKANVSFDQETCLTTREEYFALMEINGANEHRLFFN